MSQLIVDRLAACLERMADVAIEHDRGQALTFPALASGGFTISLRRDDDAAEFTITTDHWHGHYSDPIDAVLMFVQSLTPLVREKTVFRGKVLAYCMAAEGS
ncbi:hypothetical protein [uncultured Tateyamaria sp.]|uniref:hypothetical protein n=1 Tax=uncultured Tateyamaria sp. TaxID=455651 RepID=UPI00262301F7|nr:hypothetical protein [uncultured Tateyamaria sp.]